MAYRRHPPPSMIPSSRNSLCNAKNSKQMVSKRFGAENNLKGHFKVAVAEDMAKGRDVVKSSYIFVLNTR